MDDYITKPVKTEELEEVLQRWIEPPQEESLSEQSDGAAEQGEESAESLDQGVLEGLRELGDKELLAELAQVFLEDAPAKISSLRQAITEGEAHKVESEAHTLKGSSGSMGAKKMADICAELEEVGASGDLTRAPELLERLEGEFDRVRAALETEVKAD